MTGVQTCALPISDNHIPVANVRRMRNLLEDSGKTFDINVYEGAPHGFLNNTMLERYRHPQSEAAWAVQMDFLKKAFYGGFESGRAIQRFAANVSSVPSAASGHA